MQFKFNKKLVLITGSTKGIGFDVALRFLNYGAKVIITGRQLSRKNEDKIKGKDYVFFKVNFQNIVETKKFLKKFRNKKLFPDIIVNNVGGNENVKNPLCDTKDWQKVININLLTAIEVNNFFIPHMKKKKWGRICHISSISALENQGHPAYCAVKAAINAYVRSVGRYLSKDKIVMNCVMPGAILTENGYWDVLRKNNRKVYTNYTKNRMAIQRLGTPSEISNFIIFSCSEYASFSVGSAFLVDGGQGKSFQQQ